MTKKILAVGVEIPGGEVEQIDHFSRRSLLDADIVVYSPNIPYGYESDTYQGKPCLSDDGSFRAREALSHWRRELLAAVNAGKLVVVLLNSPEIVFAATGQKTFSGTGRNARATRAVEQIGSYNALPVKWQFHAASGSEMSLVSSARFLASYWSGFSKYSKYEVFLDGEIEEPLIKTKTGNRIVAAAVRKGQGALVAIPDLDFDQENFTEIRDAEKPYESFWTGEAEIFDQKLVTAFVAVANALASEVQVTPPPDWTRSDALRMPEEAEIETKILENTRLIAELEADRRNLELQLESAGELRALLYEQGKPLEKAVLLALRVFGFDAEGLIEKDSEFDAVFTSPEGRFLGEVEGKDNKSINVDKFSQLERNLNEDFSREGIVEFAKGVLFGNAFRLKPIDERDPPFSEKCSIAAKRLGVALVNTPDLFVPARYLKSNDDPNYAMKCREAIFASSGEIVVFPFPPERPRQA